MAAATREIVTEVLRPAKAAHPYQRDAAPTPPTTDPLAALRAAGALVGHDELVAATAEPPQSIWYSGVEAESHIEITGPSGGGKTTLAMMLAAARANCTGTPIVLLGRPFLAGRPDQYVVVIEEENGKFSLRRKIENVCEILGLDVRATLDRMIFVVRRRVVAGDSTWSTIEALGRAGLVSAVIVDSRARVLRQGESNKEEDQAEISNLVHRMVEACTAPVLVISHTRKGEKGSGPSDIEDISGSLQRGAGADVVLIVTAKKNDAGKVQTSTLKFAKLRDALEDHPDPISYRIGKDVEGRWTIDASASDAAERDERPLTERVLDLLAAHPDGLTKYKIREALKASGENVEKAFSALFEVRALTKEARTVNGKPRNVFRLREVRHADD